MLGGTDCATYNNIAIRINGLEPNTGYLNFLSSAFADSIFPFYRFYNDIDSSSTLYNLLVEGGMNIDKFIPRADGSSPYGTIKGSFNFIVTDENAVDTFRITDGSFRFDVPQVF